MGNKTQNSCCCGPGAPRPPTAVEHSPKPYVTGKMNANTSAIPVVDARLSLRDRLETAKVRWGIGRMKYRVEPGLYAVGTPSEKSPVFVTANYKMSFDRLRTNLAGIDSYILVLDTKGINVWCAAGKGTFGTAELVNRIEQTGLKDMVSHRKLIVPQLGATGVSAHEVKRLCGFNVHYGPIRAEDIPVYFQAGFKATPEMRRVTFSFRHRLVLVPNELVLSLKYLLLIAAVFFVISGIGKEIFSIDKALTYGIPAVVMLVLVHILGNLLPLALLPWLPGRPFYLKGIWVGLLLFILTGYAYIDNQSLFPNPANFIGWGFIIIAIVSFLTLNFTGCTTFTSLSGVKKEMKTALPVQISLASIGVILWTISMVIA